MEDEGVSDQKDEEKQLSVNAMKENLRVLVETNSENVLNLFRAIN
jgi:hypothetical protein